MEALFSCTKCLKRCPFDELSRGEQLCKDCRNNFPIVKCTYCRAEFQQNSKGSTNSICAKCAQNVKHYGKPTACENCSVLAAFIGNRCQRCVNSEKKWGPPLICEQCKLKCAFDRPEKRNQGGGKLMCWLCDQAYKRVLAKTRKAGGDLMALKHSKSSSSLVDSSSKSNTPTNNGQSFPQTQGSFEGMTVLERLTRIATSGGSSRGNTPPVIGSNASQAPKQSSAQPASSSGEADKAPNFLDKLEAEAAAAVEGDEATAAGSATKDDKDKNRQHQHRHHHHHHHRKHHHGHHHRSHSKRRHSNSKDEDESGEGKKPKADKNSANGVTAATSTPKSIGTTMSEAIVDTANSENVILITQLREQIESLKKQMALKDQQLLEKEKNITELKARMYETDKEFRLKIHKIHQSNDTVTENLQTKVRELTRQVASLSKGKKSSDTSLSILSAS
ncbi:protein FAM76A [Elysia marginata]|uniref:Protein FAM76A n=1 Tax=Elysia marginata TaxID=1093978 RepID=A0AAV4HUD1_9GAST|nr:protein FAM76A [Elysia marginata]